MSKLKWVLDWYGRTGDAVTLLKLALATAAAVLGWIVGSPAVALLMGIGVFIAIGLFGSVVITERQEIRKERARRKLREQEARRTVTVNYNDGKYRFGEGKHKFVIDWSPRNHDTVHLKKVGERGHMALVTDDEIKDLSSYKKCDRLVIGEGQKAGFQNGHGNWATIEIINVEHKKRELEFCYAIMPPTRGR